MILFIDNYDSFTYNLVHYVEELGGDTIVHRNDQISVDDALAMEPNAIILSPGPCYPKDAGICLDLIRAAPADMPILGVCLGHQAIGEAFGGDVVSAKAIMHGKTDRIFTEARGLFAGLPREFTATRYHSLAVARDSFPDDLRVDAETADGEVMGLSHVDRPVFGVQFHPESIASEHGHLLLANFLRRAGVGP
jgi:anthranilate synthase component 2